VEVVRAKLTVLRRHCEAIGRPYEEIERTAIGALNVGAGGLSAREAIQYCRRVSDAGIQHLIVSMPGDHEITPIELMGKDVIPVVAEF
jgi:hypothetical protein